VRAILRAQVETRKAAGFKWFMEKDKWFLRRDEMGAAWFEG
jgi:hypothetical protein